MADGPAGVAPSILAADFARLGEQVGAVLDAGARTIHVDVMDGHFVPPLSMGPLVVEALAGQVHAAGRLHRRPPDGRAARAPRRGVRRGRARTASRSTSRRRRTPTTRWRAVREAGCRAGLALCPGTPVQAVAELVDELDLVLCMTVNPGWGGQAFLPGSIGKLERLRALVGDRPALEVDGGIDAATAGPCARAGATVFVAGSAVFGAEDPGAAYRTIADNAGA